MSLVTRNAILQTRVTPAVKYASEQILHRIGLNMTEAMELFLRRIIVDEKIPFEVIALNDARLMQIAMEYEKQITPQKHSQKGHDTAGRQKRRVKRE